MTYHGKVRDGVVVFDGDRPAEGTVVVVSQDPVAGITSVEPAMPATGTLSQKLLALSGTVPAGAFPTDSSVNVDHYLYGLPKR